LSKVAEPPLESGGEVVHQANIDILRQVFSGTRLDVAVWLVQTFKPLFGHLQLDKLNPVI
jgi:hypothetical protein